MTSGYERNKRWRKKNPEKWLATKNRYYRKFQDVPNKNQRWTVEDIDFVVDNADRLPDRVISRLIGRSLGAIQTMRYRIGVESS